MRETILEFLHRLVALFRRRHLEDDLEAELHSHFEMSVDRNLRRGMSPEEARREATRSFGGGDQIKETFRDQRGIPMIESILQDIRFGFRMLRRNPGFSLLAILCLTMGIGANAAVFSWIEGILFRPFPAVAHQERMVALGGTTRGEAGYDGISFPDLLDYQKNCKLFDAFIVDRIMGATLSIGDKAEWSTGSVVSANYFDALGVRMALGRGFRPEENIGRNAHPVTVISYRTWKERYSGDPAIIGRTQILNGVPHTIVGVAQPGFDGTFVGYAFQFWVPASMQETFDPTGYKLEDRGARWIEGFAFLKPGVSRQRAQDEISAITKRLEVDYPATNRGRGVQLMPLWKTPFNGARTMLPTLEISLAVAVMVLLIACANVGNLLLVRSFARRHELTVRLALGCAPGRLLRQLLTEGLILSTIATAGGIVVANWCRNLLVLAVPPSGGIIINLPGAIDWRVLMLSAGVCVVSTLLVGLLPAYQAGRVDLAGALKSESGGVVGGRARARLRSGLVMVQVSLSFVLLVGVGLMIESLHQLQDASYGFSTQNLMISSFDLVGAGYTKERARILEDELVNHLQAVPGVQSAAFVRTGPISYRSYSSTPISVPGYQPGPDEQPTLEYAEVGPAYLATMGIPLVSGREFTRLDNETTPPVAIVNEYMAAQYWHGKNPVGERFQMKDRWVQVVGVAKLSKYNSIREEPRPFFYVPLRQFFSIQGILYVRTPMSSSTMAAVMVQQVHAIDPDLAPLDTFTMREKVDNMNYPQRLAVALLGAFGGMALLLAAVGLYGVMAYAVSQSSRELGLRMALGASAPDLLRLVMSQGLALTAAGVVIGALAALAMARWSGNLLYQVSPHDPLAFGTAFVVMTFVGMVACLLPAWRATRTDPVRALRS